MYSSVSFRKIQPGAKFNESDEVAEPLSAGSTDLQDLLGSNPESTSQSSLFILNNLNVGQTTIPTNQSTSNAAFYYRLI